MNLENLAEANKLNKNLQEISEYRNSVSNVLEVINNKPIIGIDILVPDTKEQELSLNRLDSDFNEVIHVRFKDFIRSIITDLDTKEDLILERIKEL